MKHAQRKKGEKRERKKGRKKEREEEGKRNEGTKTKRNDQKNGTVLVVVAVNRRK